MITASDLLKINLVPKILPLTLETDTKAPEMTIFSAFF